MMYLLVCLRVCMDYMHACVYTYCVYVCLFVCLISVCVCACRSWSAPGMSYGIRCSMHRIWITSSPPTRSSSIPSSTRCLLDTNNKVKHKRPYTRTDTQARTNTNITLP
uniref:Uncharacterized protein n=1 Tax=Anguilla anguilla TaxID=7936 RepID=A0A0E9T0M3_ANGAN